MLARKDLERNQLNQRNTGEYVTINNSSNNDFLFISIKCS
ncbi:hypothetical protein DOY81_004049 [Sarcophaga bullata]|nr:hypothetical protein DOY81_004049 [Sarcophaga bullata]